MTADLLVELFTEELPPRALPALGSAFAGSIARQLQAHGLTGDDPPAPQVHCTPRRLAVVVQGVLGQAPRRLRRVKGPSVAVGLDAQGQPTLALKKWAAKQDADVDWLTRAADGRQEFFYFQSDLPGTSLADAIESVIVQALGNLPIPKLMTYQLADGRTTVSFVRPAHRLVVLHGDQVLPCRVLGLAADRVTQGHRFQCPAPIRILSAAAYAAQLHEQGRVVTSFEARRGLIAEALQERSRELGASLAPLPVAAASGAASGDAPSAASGEEPGGTPVDDAEVAALLDEVTALVEWPAVYVGGFEDAFLEVPQECLILTMRTNQKYFPLFNADGRLLPRFLIVSNMAVEDPSAIIDGNERVVRPRLADARFFYDQDRKTRLQDRIGRLGDVVYHARLGSQAERSQRVAILGGDIAEALAQDPAPVRRAALLAKADLLTGMVGEFPELQGIMGRYYALHDGESPAVSQAIAEHYQPRFAGDALPASEAGVALALADKLETLAGIWGVGQRPTGERDPFALRRHALGVVRLLIERALPLDLGGLVDQAFRPFRDLRGFDVDGSGLHGFVCDRLRGYLRERGFEAADIEAALAVDARRLDRIENRLAALVGFRGLAEFQALAAANKRIANILRKSDAAPGGSEAPGVRTELFAEPAEMSLHDALVAIRPVVESHLQRLDFTQALKALASLRTPVDAFFERVMVNDPSPPLRNNRLALLGELRHLMNRVADLSQL